MSKSLDELYRTLNRVADQLAIQESRQVSMREALLELIDSMKLEPGDFSWSWRISETHPTSNHKQTQTQEIERGKKGT